MEGELGDLSQYKRVARISGTKYFIFIENNDVLCVRITDGISLWQCTFDDTASLSDDHEKYMTALMEDFHQLSLGTNYQESSSKMTLDSEKHGVQLVFLQITDEASRSIIQRLLFYYLEQSLDRDPPHQNTEKKTEKNDVSLKKAGMSMVNPASRKRKAARGVVYDE